MRTLARHAHGFGDMRDRRTLLNPFHQRQPRM
jgi:hypothetical protein